jgi:hypothetical protein
VKYCVLEDKSAIVFRQKKASDLEQPYLGHPTDQIIYLKMKAEPASEIYRVI